MKVLKIAVTGPESSGKSTLAEELANSFHTNYAPEFAREYLEKTGGKYGPTDLIEIAKGQLANEKKALAAANKICFFDTDMLVLKIWALYRHGTVPKFIEAAFHESDYDAYLLCKPDISWQPDPFRESPDLEERQKLFTMYKNALTLTQKPFIVISGVGRQRFQTADAFIRKLG